MAFGNIFSMKNTLIGYWHTILHGDLVFLNTTAMGKIRKKHSGKQKKKKQASLLASNCAQNYNTCLIFFLLSNKSARLLGFLFF